MILNFLLPKIQELDFYDMWFQKDAATCHTARVTMDLLRRQLGEHFISPSGPVDWPPRSCDIMPLEYFQWGYVKSRVYTDKPALIDALEDNIDAFIREIPAEMLERVSQNWNKRLDHLQRSRGQHLHEISFKHYMDHTVDLNKDFIHFSEFYVCSYEKLSYSS